jgi:hypothetical protein
MGGGRGTVGVLLALHATERLVAQQERAAIVAAVRSAQRAGAWRRAASLGYGAVAVASTFARLAILMRVRVGVGSAILSWRPEARSFGATCDKQRDHGDGGDQQSEAKLEHGAPRATCVPLAQFAQRRSRDPPPCVASRSRLLASAERAAERSRVCVVVIRDGARKR